MGVKEEKGLQMKELLEQGKVLKIALLIGKIKNAGDFLIAERIKQLLKLVYPECEINEYIRVYRLEPHLASLNSNDIAVVAGGPALLSGDNPLLCIDDISRITIPICALGVGWFGTDTKPDILYRYELTGVNLELFKRIAADTKLIGCRDMASVNILRNSGLECGMLTGCPAWYDLEKVQVTSVNKKLSGKIGKVCISDPANPGNIGKLLEVVQYVQKFIAPKEIVVLFHRGIASDMESYRILIQYLEENQITYFDIAHDWVGFKHYDDADLHIGFRVHAHLYNLSKRNISVLISEDGRGAAANETLGLPVVRSYGDVIQKDGRITATHNEYLVYQLDDVLKNTIDTNYYELERAFETMNHYYQKMIEHITMIKDFI